MTIDPSHRVGELASHVPGAADVFYSAGIEYACEGTRTLEVACDEAGLDVGDVVAALELVGATEPGVFCDWTNRRLSELIDHIVGVYHARLESDLVRLEAMTRHLASVCGNTDPRMPELAKTMALFAAELREHVAKEERVLFPWVLSGTAANAGEAVRVMLMEHRVASHQLIGIRDLLDPDRPPTAAPATWSALKAEFDRFARALERHVHLENNVLFPRALAGEAA